MHLLRAAYRGSKDCGARPCRRVCGHADPARFLYHSMCTSLPHWRDCFWRYQGSGKSRVKIETAGPQLSVARLLEHRCAHQLSRAHPQSESENAGRGEHRSRKLGGETGMSEHRMANALLLSCHPERGEGSRIGCATHASVPRVISPPAGGPSPRKLSGLGMTAN